MVYCITLLQYSIKYNIYYIIIRGNYRYKKWRTLNYTYILLHSHKYSSLSSQPHKQHSQYSLSSLSSAFGKSVTCFIVG